MDYLVKKQILEVKDLNDIRELGDICNKYESLNMKLNWSMLKNRSKDVTDDFLYYEDDRLVGFLGMYGFNLSEIEITAMVHPEYRRRGIAEKLLDEARRECNNRGIGRILYVCERSSASAFEFIKVLNVDYAFSEYSMRLDDRNIEKTVQKRVSIRPAQISDAEDIVCQNQIYFNSEESIADEKAAEEICSSAYMIELNDIVIGKIHVRVNGKKQAYISGFGILPEHRRRGYGREVLLSTIEMAFNNGAESIKLEVACENEKALALYKDCGFEVFSVLDYYEEII